MLGKRILLTVLAGCAISTYALPCFANCMSVPDGWYVEANGGSSKMSNLSYDAYSANTSGIGGNVNIGYKFVPYFAAEMGGFRYANNTLKLNGVSIGNDKHYSYDLALRGIVPMSNTGFEVFAKVGVGRMVSNISPTNSALFGTTGLSSSQHSSTGLFVGAGAQYYFMPELAVVVQWQQQNGNSSTGTGSLFSGGFSFIFD